MFGLYKGLSSPMVGVAAINAIVFGMYGFIQRRMPNPKSLSSVFVAGAAAGKTLDTLHIRNNAF